MIHFLSYIWARASISTIVFAKYFVPTLLMYLIFKLENFVSCHRLIKYSPSDRNQNIFDPFSDWISWYLIFKTTPILFRICYRIKPFVHCLTSWLLYMYNYLLYEHKKHMLYDFWEPLFLSMHVPFCSIGFLTLIIFVRLNMKLFLTFSKESNFEGQPVCTKKLIY